MADPSRRRNQRYPCDIGATLHTPSSGGLVGQARLIDLSVEGSAVETSVPLLRHVPYELRVDWGDRQLRVTARVAWEKPAAAKRGPHRFGLEFTTTSEQEELLRLLVDAVRQRLWSSRGPR